MKQISQQDLGAIFKKHKLWLKCVDSGERAYLRYADLSDAYLRYAYLRYANLRDANLSGADLSDANLRDANLRDADLSDANLWGADLRGADLSDANLRYANLRDTDLRGADLSGADLSGADLSGADLSGADLWGADLSSTNLKGTIIDCPMACPSSGEFIAYKKLRAGAIAVLRIPADAKRSSATTGKCKASKAEVLEIVDGDGQKISQGSSMYDKSFVYVTGSTVEPKESFNDNRWAECTSGIHFFMTQDEAKSY